MCCSVQRHKIEYNFSDSNLIFDQDNSVGFRDCKESPNIFNFQKIYIFKPLKSRKKLISIKIQQNLEFLNLGRRNFKQTFL